MNFVVKTDQSPTTSAGRWLKRWDLRQGQTGLAVWTAKPFEGAIYRRFESAKKDADEFGGFVVRID